MAVTLFTRALVFNKWNNRKAENGSRIQSIVTNFCKKIFPLRFSMWLEVRTLKFFKNKKNAKYLYDGMGRNIYNGAFPKEYLDDVAYADFEGYKFPCQRNMTSTLLSSTATIWSLHRCQQEWVATKLPSATSENMTVSKSANPILKNNQRKTDR